MTTENQRKLPWLAAVLVAATLALSACGGGEGPGIPTASGSSGGGSSGGTTPATVPDTAKTIDGFFAFLGNLLSDETSDPVVVGDFTPDSDDTGEGKPVSF